MRRRIHFAGAPIHVKNAWPFRQFHWKEGLHLPHPDLLGFDGKLLCLFPGTH